MSFSVERGSAGSSSVFFLHLYWIRIFELTWEFYRTDALLVIQSSMSKRWRKDEVLTLTRENYYLALSFLHLLWDCSGEMLFCLCQFCIAGVQCPINTNYNYSTKYYCKIAYVCKRLSGWIRYDNYIHITQPSAKYMYLIAMFCSPLANETSQLGTYILLLVVLYEYDYRKIAYDTLSFDHCYPFLQWWQMRLELTMKVQL